MSRLLLFICLCCFLPAGCAAPARPVQTADGAPRFADTINDPRLPAESPPSENNGTSWWGLAAAFSLGVVVGFVGLLAIALAISSQIH